MYFLFCVLIPEVCYSRADVLHECIRWDLLVYIAPEYAGVSEQWDQYT